MARRYSRKSSGGGTWLGAVLLVAAIIYIIKILLPILLIIGIVAAGYGIYYYSKQQAKGGIVLSSLALIFCLGLGGFGLANFGEDETETAISSSFASSSIAHESTTTSSTSISTTQSTTSNSSTVSTTTPTTSTTSTQPQASMDPASFLIHKPANQKISVTVSKFVDGDTTYFMLGSQMIKVRYLLIDTPETRYNQPYAAQSKDRVKQILSQAQSIEVAYDIGQKQDHYGRELMYVFADGKLVQEILAAEGLAMVRYVTPPNTQYLDQVQAAENQAKTAQRNIWSVAGYADGQGYHTNVQSTQTPATHQAPAPATTDTNGETQYVDANGNGLIKGSSSGIYHIPGSKYYDKTTHPVRMFKTISEAEQAGYRAPKR